MLVREGLVLHALLTIVTRLIRLTMADGRAREEAVLLGSCCQVLLHSDERVALILLVGQMTAVVLTFDGGP